MRTHFTIFNVIDRWLIPRMFTLHLLSFVCGTSSSICYLEDLGSLVVHWVLKLQAMACCCCMLPQ